MEKITASTLKHEIGLHGFFHVPLRQCSREVAETEVELGTKFARRFGIKPISFVFPRNEIGYLDVLGDYGFQIYRGKDAGRYDEARSFPVRRLNSAINKLITPPVLPSWKDSIWEIPTSAYFCDPRFPFTLLPRARLGLDRALRANKIFHIRIHPWSLLQYRSLLRDLDKFLAFIARKRDKDELDVMTIGELSLRLNQGLQAK